MNKTFKIDGRAFTVTYLNLPGVDEIMREVIAQDIYHLAWIKSKGYAVNVAVDVGAHMGFFGRLVQHYWPHAKVLSFEPDSALIPCIVANCGPNWIGNVAIRYNGKHDYYVSPKTGGSMIYDPTVNFCDAIPQTYEHKVVPTKHLECVNDWIGRDTPIDLLKLDCEGSEFDILCGMSEDIRRRIRLIVGEYHHVAGYHFVEKIIEMKYPHLRPRFTGFNTLDTISTFEALPVGL